MATGPLSQEVKITHSLFLQIPLFLSRGGREGCSVCLSDTAFLPVCESVAFSLCPTLSVGGAGMRRGSGANKLCLDSS